MYQDFKDKVRTRRRTAIDEIGSTATIVFFWCLSAIAAISISMWAARESSSFVVEFVDWISAFARLLLPVLIALSIAGPVARYVQAKGPAWGASLVLIFVGIAVSLGLMLSESQVPVSQSVSTKKATIFSALEQFKRGGN